jgi:SOS-response transcriptional repressor LexA
VANWESGRNAAPLKKVSEIADKLGVSIEFLTSDKFKEPAPLSDVELREEPYAPFRHADNSKLREVPVVSWGNAGLGGAYDDLAEQIAERVSTTCQDPNAYALIVEGISMLPDLLPGDRIVVNPNGEARHGDIVVARLAETGQVFLKRVEFLPGDKVRLRSTNTAYGSHEFRRDEFRFIQPIWGISERRLKR